MGRFGPLTSQALGRSPYDETVPGTGGWSHLKMHMYDSKARPFNPETHRINRDIVRAHNEVMYVIGVAEPDNGLAEAQAAALRRKHRRFENAIGDRLFLTSSILEIAGVWGVNGMRQRILLYKRYAQTPFYHLFQFQRSQQSIPSYLFSGLPAFILCNIVEALPVRDIADSFPEIGKLAQELGGAVLRLGKSVLRIPTAVTGFEIPIPNLLGFVPSAESLPWLGSVTKHMTFRPDLLYGILRFSQQYIGLHLDILILLQRAGILSSTALLPSWRYFVPGSSLSPVFLPRPPTTFTWPNTSSWLRACAIGVVPVAAFVIYREYLRYVTLQICRKVLRLLPRPTNDDEAEAETTNPPRIAFTPQTPARATSVPVTEPTPEENPRNGRDIVRSEPTTSEQPVASEQPTTSAAVANPRDDPAFQVLSGQPENESLPVGTTRRQSTISVRGDESASDEEDTEMISATLISFDVEATDTTDATTAVWSAELRPNPPEKESRTRYRDTTLFKLPPILAADLLGLAVSRIMLAPIEGQIWLGLARIFLLRQGRSVEGLHSYGLWDALNWRRWINVLGMEMILLFLQGEAWGTMTLLAESLRYTDEEWAEEMRLDEEQQRQQQRI